MAATVGDPATTPSPAGAPPACPVPSATPCFDHTALIFTLSFSSVLVDTRTVCQLMDTCSACLSGLWTLAVLVRLMDTCSPVCKGYGTFAVLVCRAYGHLQSRLSGLWTLAVLVCQAYGHPKCLSGLWTLTVLVCQAYGHSQCLYVIIWVFTVLVMSYGHPVTVFVSSFTEHAVLVVKSYWIIIIHVSLAGCTQSSTSHIGHLHFCHQS